MLVAVESPVNLPTQDAARDWIVARLTELTNVGYLELVVTFGNKPAPETEPEGETEVDDSAPRKRPLFLRPDTTIRS